MGKKITVPVDIYVPDGFEFEGLLIGNWEGYEAEGKRFKEAFLSFKPIKPAKKVIDLSILVGSGIDCEFSQDGKDWLVIQHLERISVASREHTPKGYPFGRTYCRVRQSPHVHWWNRGGSECPLPDGLRFRIWYVNNGVEVKVIFDASNTFISWANIIAFEILGVEEGWRYEWEEE